MSLLFGRTVDGDIRYGGDISFCRKWRDMGGTIWADLDVRLGHVAKKVIWGSMGSMLRRRSYSTLRYVAGKVEIGVPSLGLLEEAHDYCNNHFGAKPELLAVVIDKARNATGPILELGSGLTTVLMAAANPKQLIWCLEHDDFYAAQTRKWAIEAGVQNIMMVTNPLRADGFYEHGELPSKMLFDFALVDGPPRHLGSRDKFYEELGDRVGSIVVDDADDPKALSAGMNWAIESNWDASLLPPRTLVLNPKQTESENVA